LTQPAAPPSSPALAGLRVLDFSHALAGPYCTLLLANYGANVYKVEPRDGGDIGRAWGPPFSGGEANFFLGFNRNKRGVSINLKHPEGIALCLRLADKMDILVENFRPGTMERLGLGYTAVAARNPCIVYCSISGYGQAGPSRDEPAMDLIVQCASGLVSITGTEAGERVRSGYSAADVTAGMFATIGILMALQARERTGRGQFVDVAMLDAMISAMTSNWAHYLGSGEVPAPMGTGFNTVAPYRVFQGSDGRGFAIAGGSGKLWTALCGAIGHAGLATHPGYSTNAARLRHRASLEALLAGVFGQRPAAEWVRMLGAEGIPCSPVRTFDEVAQDPQTAFREMFPVVEHPSAGSYRATGSPIKLSDAPAAPPAPAPRIGEHTAASLRELLAMDDTAIADLGERGVIHLIDS
jgi:crotonobetainyl-CoA:carnitine CoA-transferase CaiB-like acyl-CoA transferase